MLYLLDWCNVRVGCYSVSCFTLDHYCWTGLFTNNGKLWQSIDRLSDFTSTHSVPSSQLFLTMEFYGLSTIRQNHCTNKLRSWCSGGASYDWDIQHLSAKWIPHCWLSYKITQFLDCCDSEWLLVQPLSVNHQHLIREKNSYFWPILSYVKRG